MSLVQKYVNLKEPFNQDIKEQATTKNFLKKKTGFTWTPQPQRHSVQRVFFKSNTLFAAFQVRVNDRENEIDWTRSLKPLNH